MPSLYDRLRHKEAEVRGAAPVAPGAGAGAPAVEKARPAVMSPPGPPAPGAPAAQRASGLPRDQGGPGPGATAPARASAAAGGGPVEAAAAKGSLRAPVRPALGNPPGAGPAVAPLRPASAGGAPSRRPSGLSVVPRQRRRPALSEAQLQAKNRVQEQLVSQVDARLLASPGGLVGREREEISRKVAELLEAEAGLGTLEKEAVREALLAEILGYGPIQPLLDDPEITEIMINGPEQVFVERAGRISASGVRFRDEREILRLIDKIVTPLGRRIDEANPMVDARLPDGSRVNAIIPPLAVSGPTVTIRKFARDLLEAQDLIRLGTLSPHMAQLLEACVKARLNVMVSGGTGSGKTTTLNVLSSFIPPDERIVTIEDAAELQLRQEHVVSLETRPPNIEGRGEITVRMLVRNALRMRPDRIVVGEVRSGEALDMLQAMNTGHDGSLSTAHSNSPRDMLSRLETMVLMAGIELPMKAVREQIASALDLIIHQARLRDGSRRITHITEVTGMEGEVILLQDIFLLQIDGGVGPDGRVLAHFEPTGIRPTFSDRLATRGLALPAEVFGEASGGRARL